MSITKNHQPRQKEFIDEWKKREDQRLKDFMDEINDVRELLNDILENPKYKDQYTTEGLVDAIKHLDGALTYILMAQSL